ncbi:C40 family peptidase [Parafrigoribacterium soli]|uniref:C40 family peptidase n=1 Tax=Parafrigoribacterium soli TaxID=3144663 RepID=UPI0032EE9457
MIKSSGKLAAMAAAACLIATVAIPAYAAAETSAVPVKAHESTQSLVNSSSAESQPVVARDSYTITIPPKRPAVAVNRLLTVNPPAQGYSGGAVLQYAAQFVGKVPYGMGNSPTTSFSCDGFVQYVFAGFGIALPRGADHQAALGVRISQADAVAGDFVWWPGQHIGIYDGAGGMYNSPVWGRYVEHASKLWGSPVFVRLR